MNQLTENLEITLKECRYDNASNTTAQIMNFLEKQGFTFDEIVDGLVNYAWINTNSIDAVCFLAQASLSLRKVEENK
ncbi:MAG: hypothetical protein ACYT04_78265, partial [Nostoc sp.]